MCFGFLRATSNCLRALCGLLFCLICGGPILFIVGLILLLSNNDRSGNVNAYNAAINNYNPAPVDTWVPAQMGGSSGALASQRVVVDGNLKDVLPATSRVVRALAPFSSTITFNLNNVNTFTRTGVREYAYFETMAYCESSFGCSASQMNNYCVANFGPSSSYLYSTGCSGRGNCGRCRYASYLTDYCVVVEDSANGLPPFQVSTQYSSCYYPFSENSQRYSSINRPSSISLTVRKSDDPFIALERITKGDRDFGNTRAEDRNAGIACLVIGIVMILMMICVGVLVYRLATAKKRKEEQEHHQHQQQSGGGHMGLPSQHHQQQQPYLNAGPNGPYAPNQNTANVPYYPPQAAGGGYGYGAPAL